MKKTKRMLSIILAFVIVLSLPMYCFANSGLSTITALSNGSYYYIRNKNSGLYLDAENDGNFNVIQYNFHGALNQAWKLEQISTNVYRLESQNPYYQYQGRKYLSVSEYTDNVDLFYINSTYTTQRWNITLNSSDGTFTIKSLWDNKVLQVENASTSSTADVIKATSTGSNSQKWYFEKIPSPNTSKYSLENLFPDGKFWNHSTSVANSPNSIGNSECEHHGTGVCANSDGVYDGACGCNSYYNSIQCNGFARYMAKKVYGSDIPSWTKSSNSDLLYFVKPGDYIRYDGHSVFVVDINPDVYTILVAECNYGPDCIIKWYREILIFDIMDTFEHIYIAPYVFIS